MKSLNLTKLEMEQQNRRSLKIARASIKEMLEMMNDEDSSISKSVTEEIPTISKIVESVYTSLENGGSLFYIGVGIFGQLGVLDASECPPIFEVSYELVKGLIAGGEIAILKA